MLAKTVLGDDLLYYLFSISITLHEEMNCFHKIRRVLSMVDYPNVEQDLLEWELRIRIRGNTQLPKAISNKEANLESNELLNRL